MARSRPLKCLITLSRYYGKYLKRTYKNKTPLIRQLPENQCKFKKGNQIIPGSSGLYKLLYKKNYILYKISKGFVGHSQDQKVNCFIQLKDKRYLSASQKEIIIWNQNNFQPIQKIKITSEEKKDFITKIIQLSNENLAIATMNHLLLLKLNEEKPFICKTFNKDKKGIIVDLCEIKTNAILILRLYGYHIYKINEDEVIDFNLRIDQNPVTYDQIFPLDNKKYLLVDNAMNRNEIFDSEKNTSETLQLWGYFHYMNFHNWYPRKIYKLKDGTLIQDHSLPYLYVIIPNLFHAYSEIKENENKIIINNTFDNKNNSPLHRIFSSFPIIEFPNGNIIKRIPKGMAIINIQTKQVNTFFVSEKDDMYIPSFVIDDKYFLSFSEQGAICVIE